MEKAIYLLVIIMFVVTCKSKKEPQARSITENNTEAKAPEVKKFSIDATKDAEYMVDAYANGLYTIEASEIVKLKTNNIEIKAFADRLTSTHQKVIADLNHVASNKKISLPSSLNQAQRVDLEKLKQKEPINIERFFMEQMEKEHKEDIELLEKISKESEDNDISTLAIACLSTVKTQYDEIIAVKER
jgi:putative membrane protein